MTKSDRYRAVLLCGVSLIIAGCNKQDNSKGDYQAAINDYYKAHPACLWQETKKFPVQTAEKKVFIIASKQVNNYDLSPQGRSVWTPDTNQPGYGNFCYGHRAVDSIDSFTAGVNGSGAKTAQVNYHYSIADVPAWAKSEEVKTAFPSTGAALAASQPAQDSLVMNGTTWQVTK